MAGWPHLVNFNHMALLLLTGHSPTSSSVTEGVTHSQQHPFSTFWPAPLLYLYWV